MLRLSKRESVLLSILAWIVVVAAAALYFYFKTDEMASLQQKTVLLEKQMQRVALKSPGGEDLEMRKDALVNQIQIEKDKYYHRDDIDPYQFSIVIRNLLSANGLNIKKYQTIELTDYTSLEFSLSGGVLELIEFLKAVSSAEKYWNISFLTLDARKGDGTVDAVFRINYETLDE